MIVCPACGQENPDGFRLCGMCGASLTTAPAAREERKVVTVLFCDLVGSTARAEKLDPEDVRALLSRYHEHVRRELERFGGTVEKFIGDAVMALFGAPVAHEDDPERAVRAALAVRDWAREEGDLQVRIGITTGEALVSLGARPSEGEGMAAGDVVNTAARLQAAAPVDGVLVDETTYRATGAAIDYRPHESVEAKGKADTIAVWEALQARARFGVDVRQIGGSPLVGRQHELDVLRDALARVEQERSPQLMTLVGVPGIGKSRLVWELFQQLDAEPDLVYWRQGRSLPYGDGVAFWALAEMVKAQAGILETDRPEDADDKLRRLSALLFEDASDARWIQTHLRPLVGLETELPGDRRDESFAAWRRFFEALASQRPLVLVFEDLQWAGDDLLDFVDYLADWASGVPLFVLASARPELLSRRPGWGGGKANAATLTLSPLAEDETAKLVHALLDRAVMPAEVQTALVERAGGNPLYAEEFARLVAEGRAPDDLPETVQGIIGARLDLLAEEEKALVQDAAVVGKVFWLGVAGSIGARDRRAAEEILHRLERKEFVRREQRASVAGEVEYAFRHVLVRDVAYGQIPRGLRADKHVRAARWIESLGRPEDHSEMLAHHYLAALELGRAAGRDPAELVEPALTAVRAAGDRAYALNAFSAAARYYEEALVLEPSEAERPLLLFRVAQARYLLGDERREKALEDACAALLASGEPERAAEAETLLAELWWHRGVGAKSFEHLERARELGADRPVSEAKARVLTDLSRFHALSDDYEDALRLGREAVEMARSLGLAEVEARALNNVGIAKCRLWDLSGIDDLERSIEIALAANSPEASRGYNNLGAVLFELGDFERSTQRFAEAVRVGEQLGNAAVTEYSRSIVIQQQFWRGRWDEALPLYDELLARWETGEGHYLESALRADRAGARLARADEHGALEDIRRAVEQAREARDPQALFPVLAAAARIFAEMGRVDEARAAARELLSHDKAETLLWSLVELAFAADTLRVRDVLRQHLQRMPEVTKWRPIIKALNEGDFASAADRFEAMGVPLYAARARLAAGEQLVVEGRQVEADSQLHRAIAFYRAVGATRYLRQAESLLAASA